jgi:MFS family permease
MTAAETGEAERLWQGARRTLVAGLVGSMTFVAAESLAVATVLPLVVADLKGIDLYGWVLSAFMLASLVGIVAGGRAADRFGPRPPYVVGMGFFVAGLLVAGLAPSMSVVVVGRALQGLGAGTIPTVAYVVIGRALPPGLRARMFAILSTAWVVPGVVGPAVAAQVGRLAGWRWVFLGLVPLVLAAGLAAATGLQGLGPPRAGSSEHHRVLDGVQVALGAGLVLAGLGQGAPGAAAGLVAVGAVVGGVALRRLLPPGTLRSDRGLPSVVLTRGCLTFAFFGGDAFVTLALVGGRHWTVGWASLALTGATVSWTAGAWLQAHLEERRAPTQLVRSGLMLVVAGLTGMALLLLAGFPPALGVVAWTVAGLGMGLAYAPLSLLTLSGAPSGREGWATTSLNLADVLGTALGAGVSGAAVTLGHRLGWSLSTSLAIAFLGAAGVAAIALTAGGRLVPTDRPEPAAALTSTGSVRPLRSPTVRGRRRAPGRTASAPR